MLIDSRLRAQIRRYGPYEVRGSYLWASEISSQISKQTNGKVTIEASRLVQYAVLAAEIREETVLTLGALMHRENVNERHVRRLLASDREEIVDQVLNVIRILRHKGNPVDIVKTAALWGDAMRRSVSKDYFGQPDQVDDQP